MVTCTILFQISIKIKLYTNYNNQIIKWIKSNKKIFGEKCLLGIKKNYTIQQLKTWIDPISIKDLQILKTSIKITLLAPNKYKQQWALNHLSPTLKNWISTNYAKTVLLNIEVTTNSIKSPPSKTAQKNSQFKIKLNPK